MTISNGRGLVAKENPAPLTFDSGSGYISVPIAVATAGQTTTPKPTEFVDLLHDPNAQATAQAALQRAYPRRHVARAAGLSWRAKEILFAGAVLTLTIIIGLFVGM